MYLTEINPKSGLIELGNIHDGVYAIAEFRVLLDDPELGIECMTAVALVADWMTPIRYYTEEDRPKQAMYLVKQDRKAFVWNRDVIQKALVKYDELQYNPELAEKRQLDKLLSDVMTDIAKNKKDRTKQLELFKDLKVIKELRNQWMKDNADTNVYSDAPIVNGRKLKRLEAKLLDPHSFYNTGK